MEYQQSVLQYSKSEDDGRLLDKVIAKFQEDFKDFICIMTCYFGKMLQEIAT